jgi:hypothetical protein
MSNVVRLRPSKKSARATICASTSPPTFIDDLVSVLENKRKDSRAIVTAIVGRKTKKSPTDQDIHLAFRLQTKRRRRAQAVAVNPAASFTYSGL